ncbi:MAG: twin-arginine translocase subunit TatB [Betaproteobacteria bacterium]|nr:twin-arginine translocase subunit TatB [Betaproteobacteria bacterium]
MFDIGFSQIIVIAVIALIVLGPEKLPRVARMAGHMLGRMQRYVNDVKADINRETELDELKKLQKEMQNTAQSIEQTVRGEINAVENEFKQVGDSAQQALAEVRDPIADAFADPQPLQPATLPTTMADAAPEAPPAQLELGLEPVPTGISSAASAPATPKA